MSESKRMKSIARRVSTSFVLRLLFIMLLVNIVLIFSVLGWSAYSVEKAALGSDWQPSLTRELHFDRSLPVITGFERLTYSFSLPGGETHRMPLGETLFNFIPVLNVLLIAQVIIVVIEYRGFRRKTLLLLSPLQKIAQTAQALSETQFDEQKFHSLEDAIQNISVLSPGARLSTGHSELMGLENAVNNLISRMHEAYRQQTRFVSDASHELRTPIAVIKGYAELLNRWGKDDPKVMEESVAAMLAEADNMQRLVEQLLFWRGVTRAAPPFRRRRWICGSYCCPRWMSTSSSAPSIPGASGRRSLCLPLAMKPCSSRPCAFWRTTPSSTHPRALSSPCARITRPRAWPPSACRTTAPASRRRICPICLSASTEATQPAPAGALA